MASPLGSFLQKLKQMLLDPSLAPHIRWNQSGDEIVINVNTIESILGQYFKTSSFQNFTQRLYNYGFRKLSKDSILGICHYGGQINFRRDNLPFSAEDLSSGSLNSSQIRSPSPVTASNSSSINPVLLRLSSPHYTAHRSERMIEQLKIRHLHHDLTSAYSSVMALAERLHRENSKLRSENQFMILQIEKMVSSLNPSQQTQRSRSTSSKRQRSSSSSPSSSPTSKHSR